MKKVFIDSSVLVSACASNTGASALILGLSKNNQLITYISLEVIAEARKNVISKLGLRGQKNLAIYLKKANLNLTPSPSPEKIKECESFINEKDAPILASALNSDSEIILSLDKKHFIQEKVKDYVKPRLIQTPGEFIQQNLKIIGLPSRS